MQVNVAFRHMEPSHTAEAYAADKLRNVVGKYVAGQDVDSRIVFSTERYLHVANFTVNVNGLTVKAVEKSDALMSSIDLALEKVERQLLRHKRKIRAHRHDGRRRAFTMSVLAAPTPAEPEPADDPVAEAAEAWTEPPRAFKTETYAAPFLSVNDAILQLELLEREFFVFTHNESERINIVYRRDDGHLGLIDAEPSHPS